MLSPEEKGYLLKNPDVFLTRYFPHVLGHPLEDFHIALIRAATEQTKSLVLYPAAHGKTTIVSTLLPIWGLCQDPNTRMCIIAKNDDDAKNIMNAIISELLGNDELIKDFGPFKAEDKEIPFGASKLTVAGRTRNHKSPTLAAFGSGSRGALGHRTDWTICDDIIHDQNSSSPENRGKILEWFNQGAQTQAEDPEDRLTVVGTLFHPEDLYSHLMALKSPETGKYIWHVEHYDAIASEEKKLTLWPKRWPWDRLMGEKAALGTLDFNKRFRNKAVDPDAMVFREEYIKGQYVKGIKYPGCLDENHIVGRVPMPNWPVYTGFDPAIGKYRTAKFCAHMTIALGSCSKPGHEQCIWVIDLERDQMSLPHQVEMIFDKHERYNAFVSMIEANSYQQGLLDELNRRGKESGAPIKTEPHYTTKQTKPDPELGVPAMSPHFENGLIHIPYGNPESMRKMQIFIDELVQYPGGNTTDTVMAFWFAWRKAKEGINRMRTANRLYDGPRREYWKQTIGPRRVLLNPYYQRD